MAPRPTRRRWIPLLVIAVVVVALLPIGWVAFIGWQIFELETRHHIPVDVTVALQRDGAGTRVEIVQTALGETFPTTVSMSLQTVDVGRLSTGEYLSEDRMRYSDVRDGRGQPVPAKQLADNELHLVTDGHQVRLTYHVDPVGGRRVIYPLPGNPVLTWKHAQLPTGVRCWGATSSSDDDNIPDFEPCVTPESLVDSPQNYIVRVELPA